MSIEARYSGTCAVTDRKYPAGTEIRKTDHGWALDDGHTASVLALLATATTRFSWNTRDFFGDWIESPYEDGLTLRHERELVTIVALTSSSFYDDDVDGWNTSVTAHARPANAEETARFLAEEAAHRAAVEADRAREEARRELEALPKVPLTEVLACERVETIKLNAPSSYMHGRYAYWTEVHVYADGSVVEKHYNGDNSMTWGDNDAIWLFTDPSAADVARRAAHPTEKEAA